MFLNFYAVPTLKVRKKAFASVTHLYPQRSNGSAQVFGSTICVKHIPYAQTYVGGNRPTPLLQDVTQRKEEKYDALQMRQISP